MVVRRATALVAVGQQLGGCFEQRVDIERFAEEGIGSVFASELFVAWVGVCGNDDNFWQGGVPLSESIEDGETAAAGHDQIEHDQFGCIAFDSDQRLGAVSSQEHCVPLAGEGFVEHFEDRLVVVDKQHAVLTRLVHSARLAPQPVDDRVH